MRITVLIASLLFAASSLADTGTDTRLHAVIDSDARPAAEQERDRYRNPYDTLRFFGIAPEQTVVELFPGNGWYTAILAPYLEERGHFTAAHFNLDREPLPDFYVRVLEGYRERFPEVSVVPFDPPAVATLGEPGSADLVLTFRNVHSWMRDGILDEVFASAYTVLRSGGVFGVVGHRLPEDRQQDPKASSGYVKESVVIAAAERAGFHLDARSEINANPADTADHPGGVWTLPPMSRVPEGDDPETYASIGESDRFTLRFRKP